MEKSKFVLNTVDRNGHDLIISVEGVDDHQLAHFGGLDLHVKATKEMISDINGTSFPEKEGDYLITEKVIALYLNEIGELIRNSSLDPEYLEGFSNTDLVKDFLNNIEENKFILDVIEKDNELIKKHKDEIKHEEDQIWNNILSDIHDKNK
ncbi:hypothetical protein J7E63_12790 [Bacillus sp. ISL-75]|uniref:hypothetical protein n=1 Tax=Bacillus sp. ISL-75 TaxID=2819137 RepID=UPI001BE952D8|nr:hypothetical protein [Bacillus sp. ISL-75]MBT2727815.1 hypothetical protein [Bacillus sp. ISL-75]